MPISEQQRRIKRAEICRRIARKYRNDRTGNQIMKQAAAQGQENMAKWLMRDRKR